MRGRNARPSATFECRGPFPRTAQGPHCECSQAALRVARTALRRWAHRSAVLATPHCEDFLTALRRFSYRTEVPSPPQCGPLSPALRCRHPRTAAPSPPHCGGRGPHCDTRVRHARTALRGPSAAAWVAPTAWVAPPPLPTDSTIDFRRLEPHTGRDGTGRAQKRRSALVECEYCTCVEREVRNFRSFRFPQVNGLDSSHHG